MFSRKTSKGVTKYKFTMETKNTVWMTGSCSSLRTKEGQTQLNCRGGVRWQRKETPTRQLHFSHVLRSSGLLDCHPLRGDIHCLLILTSFLQILFLIPPTSCPKCKSTLPKSSPNFSLISYLHITSYYRCLGPPL